MIEVLLPPSEPISCVTTVAGSPRTQPRFILELHTPDEDIRVELCTLRSVAFLRRAVAALHRDALHLGDRGDLQTRVFTSAAGPEQIPLWAAVHADA